MAIYCKWFKELSKWDTALIGRKAANLAELFNEKFPVPQGFVVTTNAFEAFLKDRGFYEKLTNSDLSAESILNSSVSNELREEIEEFYNYIDTAEELRDLKLANHLLKSGRDPPFVAVRPSHDGDLQISNRAVLLNKKGAAQVVRAVQECWASLLSAKTAVVVQKQIDSEKSGVAHSANINSNNNGEILLEAGWGIGKPETANVYILDKNTGELKEKNILGQIFMYVRDEYTGKTLKKNVLPEKQKSQILTDFEIKNLHKLAIDIENYYGTPQEIEWAIAHGKIYLLRTKSIEATQKAKEVVANSEK